MTYSASATETITSSKEVVWNALTKPEEVKGYFFETNLVTTWEVGTPIFFRGEWGGNSYEDKGTVLAFVPDEMLSYDYYSPLSSAPDVPEEYHILTYTLTEQDGVVTVTIDQSNVSSQEKADHSSKNWTMVLTALKEYVEKKSV